MCIATVLVLRSFGFWVSLGPAVKMKAAILKRGTMEPMEPLLGPPRSSSVPGTCAGKRGRGSAFISVISHSSSKAESQNLQLVGGTCSVSLLG